MQPNSQIIYLSGKQIPHFEFPDLPHQIQSAIWCLAEFLLLLFLAMAFLLFMPAAAVVKTSALEFHFIFPLLLRIPFESSKCQQAWSLFESPDMIQEAMSYHLPNGTHYCQHPCPRGGAQGNPSRWSVSSDSQKLSWGHHKSWVSWILIMEQGNDSSSLCSR